MLSNQSVPNEKSRDLAVTKPQGGDTKYGNGNSTILKDSKSRYEKGMGYTKRVRLRSALTACLKSLATMKPIQRK